MFFTYNQNHSGGYFVEDLEAGICESVIIEAGNADEAGVKLGRIGESVSGFNNYCPCCGERWSTDWMDDDDGTETPEIYGESVSLLKKASFRTQCFIHYEDGRKEHVQFGVTP